MIGKTRMVLAAAAAGMLLLSSGAQAIAGTKTSVTLVLHNSSPHYAWVDLSSSIVGTIDWTIRRSFCLAPGHTATERDVPLGEIGKIVDAQLRVRAEFKSGDCRGEDLGKVQSKINFGPGRHDAYGRITIPAIILSHRPL